MGGSQDIVQPVMFSNIEEAHLVRFRNFMFSPYKLQNIQSQLRTIPEISQLILSIQRTLDLLQVVENG